VYNLGMYAGAANRIASERSSTTTLAVRDAGIKDAPEMTNVGANMVA